MPFNQNALKAYMSLSDEDKAKVYGMLPAHKQEAFQQAVMDYQPIGEYKTSVSGGLSALDSTTQTKPYEAPYKPNPVTQANPLKRMLGAKSVEEAVAPYPEIAKRVAVTKGMTPLDAAGPLGPVTLAGLAYRAATGEAPHAALPEPTAEGAIKGVSEMALGPARLGAHMNSRLAGALGLDKISKFYGDASADLGAASRGMSEFTGQQADSPTRSLTGQAMGQAIPAALTGGGTVAAQAPRWAAPVVGAVEGAVSSAVGSSREQARTPEEYEAATLQDAKWGAALGGGIPVAGEALGAVRDASRWGVRKLFGLTPERIQTALATQDKFRKLRDLLGVKPPEPTLGQLSGHVSTAEQIAGELPFGMSKHLRKQADDAKAMGEGIRKRAETNYRNAAAAEQYPGHLTDFQKQRIAEDPNYGAQFGVAKGMDARKAEAGALWDDVKKASAAKGQMSQESATDFRDILKDTHDQMVRRLGPEHPMARVVGDYLNQFENAVRAGAPIPEMPSQVDDLAMLFNTNKAPFGMDIYNGPPGAAAEAVKPNIVAPDLPTQAPTGPVPDTTIMGMKNMVTDLKRLVAAGSLNPADRQVVGQFMSGLAGEADIAFMKMAREAGVEDAVRAARKAWLEEVIQHQQIGGKAAKDISEKNLPTNWIGRNVPANPKLGTLTREVSEIMEPGVGREGVRTSVWNDLTQAGEGPTGTNYNPRKVTDMAKKHEVSLKEFFTGKSKEESDVYLDVMEALGRNVGSPEQGVASGIRKFRSIGGVPTLGAGAVGLTASGAISAPVTTALTAITLSSGPILKWFATSRRGKAFLLEAASHRQTPEAYRKFMQTNLPRALAMAQDEIKAGVSE